MRCGGVVDEQSPVLSTDIDTVADRGDGADCTPFQFVAARRRDQIGEHAVTVVHHIDASEERSDPHRAVAVAAKAVHRIVVQSPHVVFAAVQELRSRVREDCDALFGPGPHLSVAVRSQGANDVVAQRALPFAALAHTPQTAAVVAEPDRAVTPADHGRDRRKSLRRRRDDRAGVPCRVDPVQSVARTHPQRAVRRFIHAEHVVGRKPARTLLAGGIARVGVVAAVVAVKAVVGPEPEVAGGILFDEGHIGCRTVAAVAEGVLLKFIAVVTIGPVHG